MNQSVLLLLLIKLSDSQHSLESYKFLLDKYLPQSILILDKNLTIPLFFNEAFKRNFEPSETFSPLAVLQQIKKVDHLESPPENYPLQSSTQLN